MGEFKISAEDKKPLMLIDDDDDDVDSVDHSEIKSKALKARKSKKNLPGSVKSSNSKATSALGYQPLKQN